jgi:hypothetical protein
LRYLYEREDPAFSALNTAVSPSGSGAILNMNFKARLDPKSSQVVEHDLFSAIYAEKDVDKSYLSAAAKRRVFADIIGQTSGVFKRANLLSTCP